MLPYLLHDSLLVVIAQRAAELVVVHGRTVLLHPPQPGHLRTNSTGDVKAAHLLTSTEHSIQFIRKIENGFSY